MGLSWLVKVSKIYITGRSRIKLNNLLMMVNEMKLQLESYELSHDFYVATLVGDEVVIGA